MKTLKWQNLTLILVISLFLYNCQSRKDTTSEIKLWPESKLWPEIKPFQSGYLKVSEIHEIYYELCGNPKVKPVFVIHGGPGMGCSPVMRQFFKPDKFLIVLHDQRGAGKSKPRAEIRENTTQNLVEDIEQLRKKLNLEKIILFGGSWGSTLSLAYAETYPENVSGMVLRGVWFGSKEESDNFWKVIPLFFPEMYKSLTDALPDSVSEINEEDILKLLQSENPAVRAKYAKLVSRYEYKACGLNMTEKSLDEYYGSENNLDEIYTVALFEHFYNFNGFFLEEDQLLKGTYKIQSIPTIIINGRYDMICPPVNAFKLHQKLPLSKLIIVEEAGHLASEKPIEKELQKAMRDFE
jgi:proline iminopeptidase